MPSPGIAEALQCNRTHRPWLVTWCDTSLRAVRSVLSEEKKLSIAALSQTLPDLLIEQETPLSASNGRNGSLVYWLSLIGVMQQGFGLAAPPDGHEKCIGHDCAVIDATHRPADHTPQQIDDGCHMSQPSAVQILGEVSDPLGVGH